MPTAYGHPNCVGRYVADRGVYADAGGSMPAANGDAVARWEDQSGAGNHLTQSTPGDRPVYCTYSAAAPAGGPASVAPFGFAQGVDQPSFGRSVLFDGATSVLTMPATLAVPDTGCTIVACTRGPGLAPVCLGTDGIHAVNYGWAGGTPQRMAVYTPAAGVVPFPAATFLPVLQPIVHALRCSASLAETRVYVGTNQQSALPANYANVPLTGGAVGRTPNVSVGTYGDFPFTGEVLELIVFASPLTDAMMAALLADVQAAHGLPADGNTTQVVFVGDDAAAPGPGTQPISRCYPWHLCRQYGGSVKPLLVAGAGQTIAQQQTLVSDQVLPLDRTPFTASVAVVSLGTTDLAAGTPADTAAAGVAAVCGSLRSAGFKVVVTTVPPTAPAAPALNAAIRSGHPSYADALADWAADLRLADPTDTAYFDPDGVHTTAAGDGVKAQLVKAAIDPLLPPTTANVAPLSFATFYAAGRTYAGRFGNFPRG